MLAYFLLDPPRTLKHKISLAPVLSATFSRVSVVSSNQPTLTDSFKTSLTSHLFILLIGLIDVIFTMSPSAAATAPK